MPTTVKLAEYLFTRLKQLGVDSIHGVPGDYNLELLDYIEPKIHWVGNCNELNAGYAADAYSRIKGLGALITTFGVGELSAINAIAGAYAELAPVVHIVGTPARNLQETRALIHHTFNDGEYRRFAQMHAHITVAQASLRNPRSAPQMIDETIQQCLIHSRPVYIEVPVDMVAIPVSAERLQSKIELPEFVPSTNVDTALSFVLERIYSSKQTVILVDGESKAYGIIDELNELITKTNWPTFVTGFGKGLVDESLPNVHGIWKGTYATKQNRDIFDSSDLILSFGSHFSNTNSFKYTSIPDPTKTIHFMQTSVKAPKAQVFRDLPSKNFLSLLLKQLDVSKVQQHQSPHTTTTTTATNGNVNGVPTQISTNDSDPVTQDQFYTKLSKCFRPGDIILAETGTAGIGSRDIKLPPQTQLLNPVTWLSIGYMLPATQGAALAQRELYESGKWPNLPTPSTQTHSSSSHSQPRCILMIGDGSFQMTAQELSTIIRLRLNVTVILINNTGYTIERCLHGYKQRYNDIAFWRYLQAPSFFGADDPPTTSNNNNHSTIHNNNTSNGNSSSTNTPNSKIESTGYPAYTYTVRTWADFQRVFFEDETMTREEENRPSLKMIEVFMGQEDAPEFLLEYLAETKEKEDKIGAQQAEAKVV